MNHHHTNFDALKLSLASPEIIKSWSYGEVTKPETINYRTLKPEKDGLFDERIFGPTKDYECYCGKYKRVRFKGVVCDKCGVEVTVSRVRRERMGHITLAAPVVHTWMFKRNPAVLPYLLGVGLRDLESVIYLTQSMVTRVDKDKKRAVLQGLESQLRQKKKELEKEIEAKIAELKKETEAKTKQIKSKKKLSEADELKIESIAASNRKEVLYLREELIEASDKMEEVYEEVRSLVKKIEVKFLLSDAQVADLRFWQADGFFETQRGAKALLKIFEQFDTREEIEKLQKKLASKSKTVRKKAVKRLRILKGFKETGLDPKWAILTVLPVIPPELRPMVQLPGGRFATSDLNDLYRKVINRNNRLKNLLNLGAPYIILQNEMRMLQEAVDALIEGPRRPTTYRGRKELKSLSEVLKGKQGRFRQNLLGKRVDYSGRSVIVVGPELKVSEVGLPKEMALELFKPFVLREVILKGFAPNLKSAKNVLEARGDEVWDILDEVTRDRPVLLNRAPTLHRQNIQAFYPVLIEGSAIQLHPAVCSGFNADFDGDQMAVHVPLSEKAIEEASQRLLSPLSILKLADGQPIIDLQKEFSVGLYYLTFLNPHKKGGVQPFLNPQSAIAAYQRGLLHVQAPIQVRIKNKVIETTVGRLIFNELLPSELRYYNKAVNRARMRALLGRCFKLHGNLRTVALIDDFKRVGLHYATTPGISVSVFDFETPQKKEEYLKEAEEKLEVIEENYQKGLMTERERRAQLVALWEETTTKVSEDAVQRIDPYGALSVMIGAGGSRADKNMVRQVEGMRGLMIDSQGSIKETPIRTAMIEQATAYEGFLSSIGGRKGLIDTALLTAGAGYLTRRLVDVAHDVLVREIDCGAVEPWWVKEDAEVEDWPLLERITGRVAGADIKAGRGPGRKRVVVERNQLITEELAAEIVKLGIDKVPIRSPLNCQTPFGVCSLCYGVDMSTRELVGVGEAVGVIAAQSIGEPGTQLTLRTFHAGGIAKKEITQGLPRVEELFEVRTPKAQGILSELSGRVTVKEKGDNRVVMVEAEEGVKGKKIKDQRVYTISSAIELKVKTGDLVSAGDVLTEGHLGLDEILRLRGMSALQAYLLKEIQAVYRSQGVTINDKHVEIILRKMTDKVRVLEAGDSRFLPGEHVEMASFQKENRALKKAGKRLAKAKRVVLGLIRAALVTDSWLSAASFIETPNVLTATAINARPQIDYLLGLKENVIIGRLIPTGERAQLENIGRTRMS